MTSASLGTQNEETHNASEDLWLGIDVGTQSIKGMVVNSRGAILADASSSLTSHRQESMHQQDPHQWIAGCAEVTRKIVTIIGPGAAAAIRAVATCSTSGTLAPVTGTGVPTGSGIMYDDGRARSLFEELKKQQSDLSEQFGAGFQSTWALAKLCWLQRDGLPLGTKKILHQTDVVSAAIAGHLVSTDWSSALKSGYDLEQRRWPVERFEALGIDAELLPQVVAPGTVLGVSSTDWQRQTGLLAGTVIVAGMTDGCAAQIGAGALEPGDWHSVVGTTLVFKGVSQKQVFDDSGAVYSHLSPDGNSWFPGGASNVGAGSISALLPARNLDALASQAAPLWQSMSLKSPVCYPLLGIGERFPLARPNARGFLIDEQGRLPFDSSLAAVRTGGRDSFNLNDPMLMASIMLGIACVERLSFELFAEIGAPLTGRLTTSGGGSRSHQWIQLRSSMLNRPLHLMKSSEGSFGMAILAAWSLGAENESLAVIAKRMNQSVQTVEPKPVLVESAEAHYSRFTSALVQEGWMAP